jgi:hypothetical protein
MASDNVNFSEGSTLSNAFKVFFLAFAAAAFFDICFFVVTFGLRTTWVVVNCRLERILCINMTEQSFGETYV